MDDLKKINDEAYSWLRNIPAETWSKSHFSGRDKPSITCLEYIREYLMKRLCIVQKKIDKCQGEITVKYVAKYNGAGKYQVASTWQDQYVVNLNERSFTCRLWEIIRFLFRHVVSAIWNKIENGEDAPDVEDWVHPCYKLSTWRAMYLNKIDPINDHSIWPKSDCLFTLTPPKQHTLVVMSTRLNMYFEFQHVGRPKKKRRRGVYEPNNQTTKLSRKFLAVTCNARFPVHILLKVLHIYTGTRRVEGPTRRLDAKDWMRVEESTRRVRSPDSTSRPVWIKP
uniref:Uncharacterized protein n=1 Tax=Lactuca sativa TaxID=4236 RepID=A0A9R1XDP4_LACSA|nr:hypothetical protein LSAT_V11C400179440 [Lactuca sativa]